MNDKVKGYLLGAIAAATYGMNPLFALPLYKDGLSPDTVLFFRYLFAIPILAIMIRARGRNFSIERRNLFPLVIFGILFAFSSLTLFRSYTYMDAGIASTLLFVYPIMVALIMFIFFHEKVSLQTLFCIVMALGGIALLFKAEDGTTLSVKGTLLVMASALSYAIYIVGINNCRLKAMATIKVSFYVLLFGWVVIAVSSVASGGFHLPDKWYMWIYLLLLALLPTAISLLCTTSAIKLIGATPTAILGALEPVTALIFGVTIFHEVITPRDMMGIILIIAAVSIVVAGGSISSTLVRFRKMFPKLSLKKSDKKQA
jgi:drug/metabolite transporter (DMT)-like permease